MSIILHLTTSEAWRAAQQVGEYRPSTLQTDGFIHCSLPEQIVRVANTWFAGQSGLVLLVIDSSRIRSEVRFEPGADKADELFPHVYGPINLDAVVQVIDYRPAPDGRFTQPEIV